MHTLATDKHRWIDSAWTNQRGEVGYKYNYDIYRPNIRVDKQTPITFSELSNKQIEKEKKEKAKTGRVRDFGKL